MIATLRLRIEQVGALLVAVREATGLFAPDIVELARRDYAKAVRS